VPRRSRWPRWGHPDLPVAELDGPAREVKPISDQRRDQVVQRTRIASQIRWYLRELDADANPFMWVASSHGCAQSWTRSTRVVAHLTRDPWAGATSSTVRSMPSRPNRATSSVGSLPTCCRAQDGGLSAAVMIGETAGVHRFRDKYEFAPIHQHRVRAHAVRRQRGRVPPRRSTQEHRRTHPSPPLIFRSIGQMRTLNCDSSRSVGSCPRPTPPTSTYPLLSPDPEKEPRCHDTNAVWRRLAAISRREGPDSIPQSSQQSDSIQTHLRRPLPDGSGADHSDSKPRGSRRRPR